MGIISTPVSIFLTDVVKEQNCALLGIIILTMLMNYVDYAIY